MYLARVAELQRGLFRSTETEDSIPSCIERKLCKNWANSLTAIQTVEILFCLQSGSDDPDTFEQADESHLKYLVFRNGLAYCVNAPLNEKRII